MIRTIVAAVLIAALLVAIGWAQQWYSGHDAAVAAAVLFMLLAAMLRRHLRFNNGRSSRNRTKSTTAPRWLAVVLACVAAIAPVVGWGVRATARWTRDQIVDSDRSQVEVAWRRLREEGKWQQAVELLQQRIKKPASDGWRQTLLDDLNEALLNKAACVTDDQARAVLAEANQVSRQQRVQPDVASALADRLEQRAQRQALETELSQTQHAQSERDQLHAAKLRKLEEDVAARQHDAAQAQVTLRLRLGDALGTRFAERRAEYVQARTIALRHGLDTHPVDEALAALDREIAAARPVKLDPQVRLRLLPSELADTSPVRIVDFTIDAPSGVTVPPLQFKDCAALEGNRTVPVLAMDTLDRSQQRLQLVVLLDTSASMRGPRMEEAKRGAIQLFANLSPSADITVFSFQDTVQRIIEWNADTRVAAQAIAGLQAQGGTALLRAIETALVELASRPQPRAIVLLTDGKDSAGGKHTDELMRIAREQRVAIHAIGLQTAETDFSLLQELAESTAGTMRTVDDVGQLAGHFTEVASALRRPAYRIVLPTGVRDDDWTLRVGTDHTLRLPAVPAGRRSRRQ